MSAVNFFLIFFLYSSLGLSVCSEGIAYNKTANKRVNESIPEEEKEAQVSVGQACFVLKMQPDPLLFVPTHSW